MNAYKTVLEDLRARRERVLRAIAEVEKLQAFYDANSLDAGDHLPLPPQPIDQFNRTPYGLNGLQGMYKGIEWLGGLPAPLPRHCFRFMPNDVPAGKPFNSELCTLEGCFRPDSDPIHIHTVAELRELNGTDNKETPDEIRTPDAQN